MTDTDRILATLAERAEDVCRHYLPKGTRQGAYWMVGDKHGSEGDSMFVRITGPGQLGKWQDAATGDFGDLVDIIQATMNLSGFSDALKEAKSFLGSSPIATPYMGERWKEDREADRKRRKAVQWLWRSARGIEGTPAQAYLRARSLRETAHPSLRYLSALMFQKGKHFPGLIAGAINRDRKLIGLQRTFLDPVEPRKANVTPAKKSLGSQLGAFVPFGTVTSGCVMVIAEGVENALTLLECVDAATCAAATLGAGGMGTFVPPSRVGTLLIASDVDQAAARAATRLMDRCRQRGLPAHVLCPEDGDWNDCLRSKGHDETRTIAERQFAL